MKLTKASQVCPVTSLYPPPPPSLLPGPKRPQHTHTAQIITLEELAASLANSKHDPMTLTEIRSLFKLADANHDGRLTLEE